jgi:hypothetical protein
VNPAALRQASLDSMAVVTLMLDHLRGDNPSAITELAELLEKTTRDERGVMIAALSGMSATLLVLLAEEMGTLNTPEEMLQHVALAAQVCWEPGAPGAS